MSVVLCVGLAGPNAPLDLIEQSAVGPDDLAKSLARLVAAEGFRESVLLSTCLRTEAYVVADRYHSAVAEVRGFFADHSGLSEERISEHLFAYEGDHAVTHLFRLAAGLESASLGETEILGQIRRADEGAALAGTLGPTLHRLFRFARRAGRRARVETGIGRGAASLAHAAVLLASPAVRNIDAAAAVVVGAGEVGTDTARALRGASATLGITIVSRTPSAADALAAEAGGTSAPLSSLQEVLQTADLVVTCTSASEAVLDRAMVEAAGRDLVLVDLGVPRDIDPEVVAVPGIRLFDMDDIAAYAAGVAEGRRREVPKVERIVDRELAAYREELSARAVAPLVSALHARAELIRGSELERHARLLGDVTSEQKEVIDALTRALVAKLVHTPSVRLKSASGTGEGEHMAEAFRRLYDL